MKGTLTFTLPEEREEFDDARRGGDWKAAVFEFDQFLRSEIKYTDKDTTVHQALRDKLHELIQECGLSL